MYQYPYGNAQQLNLDWILGKIQELESGSGGSADLEEIANALISASYAVQNYNRSDIVFYNGKLYRANQNITAEAWDSAHWDEILLGDTVANLVRYVSNLNNSQVFNSSSVTGTYTSDALNNLAADISYLNTKTQLPVNPCLKEARLISHQGGNVYVKSTDMAFINAIMQGFKVIEADLRKTSDNVLIIWHDATIGTLTVSESTWAEINAVSLDYGAKVLTYEEFIDLCNKNSVVAEIDLTHIDLADVQTYAQTIYNTAKNINKTLDNVYFTGSYGKLTNLTAIDPSIILCISGITDIQSIGSGVTAMCKNSRYPLMSQNRTIPNADVISWCHNNNVVVKFYTPTSLDRLETDFAAGADKAIVENISPTEFYQYCPLPIYNNRVVNLSTITSAIRKSGQICTATVAIEFAVNLTSSQQSVFTYPDGLAPSGSSFGVGVMTKNGTDIPVLIQATANYINILHGGATAGDVVRGFLMWVVAT